MDNFRGRPRQRTTPRPKIRHTSVTPDYKYFNFTPSNTSARHRAKEQSFPYRRQRNTAPQSRPVKNRNNTNIQKRQNREFNRSTHREVSRPGPSQRFPAPQNDRYEKVADPYRSPYHESHFGPVAGPYRPPGKNAKGKKSQKRAIRETRPRQDDRVVHKRARREYLYEGADIEDEDGFPLPQHLEYRRTIPSFRNNYTHIPSNQRPRTVSFNFNGGGQRDVNPSIGNTYPHFTNWGGYQQRRPPPINSTRARPARENENRFRQNPDFTPAPPQLKTTIKLFYDLIRQVHHLERVTTQVQNNQPVTFKRLTDLLIETVRPAFPNDRVTQLLQDNAKNWSYTTQLLLERHYESMIDATIQSIRAQTNQADWPEAFEVASHWADRNYRSRISAEAIAQAEALITAEIPIGVSTTTQKAPTETRGTALPRTYATVVASTSRTATQAPAPRPTEPPANTAPVRQTVSQKHIEIQTSPTLCLPEKAGTSSPPHRGDWSFEEEVPPQDLPESLLPIQAEAPQPCEQRKRTHKSRHINPGAEPSLTVPPPQSRPETPRPEISVAAPVAQSRPVTPVPEISVLVPLPQEEAPQVNDRVPTPQVAVATPEPIGAPNSSPVSETEHRLFPFPPMSTPIAYSDHSSFLFSDDSPTPVKPPSPLSEFLREFDPIQPAGDMGVEKGEPSVPKTAPSLCVLAPGEDTNVNEPLMIDSPSSGSLNRPLRHINTTRKHVDWSLTLKKRVVIIGDSNLSRLPHYEEPDLQVDSFPGAKFQHACNLLEKATVARVPEKIVLSFGLNNRKQRYRMTAITEIQKTYKIAKRILPQTEIIVPLINFSRVLPQAEQDMLEHINSFIKKNLSFIPLLAATHFHVEKDGLHWRPTTAKALLTHWASHLNL